ncbi:MAG: threonine-phosphate decarboxylase, partial [Rhodobacterales bacterium]|nr:threonine-phosphate decarboxylase [Rhodobacterales bacterium]
MSDARDHGGGLDVAISKYGGTREQWIDLSTGINPSSYTIPKIPKHFWNSLPDSKAQKELLIQA